MEYIKKIIFRVLVFLFCFLTLSESVNLTFASDKKTLLIINSYHNGQIWEGNVLKGVFESLESYQKNDIQVKVEYLDFRHNFEAKYLKEFNEMLEVKYPKGTIDGIYAVDDEAFIFIKDYILNKESQFYKVPLLFSGVNSKIVLSEEEKKYITGIYERDDTVQLINLIVDMNKDIQNLDVIIEDSEYGKSLKNEIYDNVDSHWNGDIEINFIEGNYIEDLESSLKQIDFNDNSAVVIAGEYQYKLNQTYVNPIDTINVIKKYSNNPIYSNDQTYIDAGILGGCIDLGEDHGKSIIDKFRSILNGEDIFNIETNLEPSASKFINYKEIYEFNINPKDIPLYSIVRNKKFYNLLVPNSVKYIIILLFIGIIALIAKLSVQAYKEKKKRIYQEELEKVSTDYIISMSHELRTPINIILNTVRLLESMSKDNTIDSKYLNMRLNNISKNSFRLLKVVNNIIDFSKLRLGFLSLHLENTDMVYLTRTIFESIDDYCAKKDIYLSFESSEDEIITAVDSKKIHRVILNILSNAIKFTEEGGEIHGFIEKSENNLVITISDTGIGIDKELLDKIFLKFYQVDDILTRRNEGNGIGLNICSEIVSLHNGEIVVQSEVGKGSVFKIIIPIIICDNKNTIKRFNDSFQDIHVEMSDID